MKRFTETEKWRDPWFQKLDPQIRTLWLWVCDRVDNAGVIDICWPICNAETTGSFTEECMLKLGDRVERLENGKWFLPKFTEFQFGKLSEDPNHKVHKSILSLLSKHRLSDRVAHRVYHTPKDKEKEKDKEKDSLEIKSFNEFWIAYPRKVGKRNAYKEWKKIDLSNETLKAIMDSLKKQAPLWNDLKYVKYPERWIRGRCWEDEIIKSNGIKISKSFAEMGGE